MASETTKYVIERQYTADDWHFCDERLTAKGAIRALDMFESLSPNDRFRLIKVTTTVLEREDLVPD